MFSYHKSLQALYPSYMSYIKKMLNITEGKKGIEILHKEQYAREVYSRSNALQTAYDTLSLSIEYLMRDNFTPSTFDFEKHYQYHLENFYLSVFGIIDRCYLVAGVSIMLDDSQIDKLGSKKTIENHLKEHANFEGILEALIKLKSNQDALLDIRNVIAHKGGIDDEHLQALQFWSAFPSFKVEIPDDFDITEAEEILKKGLKKKTKKELDLIKHTLTTDLNDVFQNLATIYNNIKDFDMMNDVKYSY